MSSFVTFVIVNTDYLVTLNYFYPQYYKKNCYV